ncbi:hypothetical protein EYF80_037926 [Liparis tanakae]|uniref:Uncharacterized protein n=1 Tax=Liparis tanakae TaxID=230148 RepID=A0A4Z2GEX6_9TELE|nr:hypothetical protein EYF80_037926 [Liparis tanakae]
METTAPQRATSAGYVSGLRQRATSAGYISGLHQRATRTTSAGYISGLRQRATSAGYVSMTMINIHRFSGRLLLPRSAATERSSPETGALLKCDPRLAGVGVCKEIQSPPNPRASSTVCSEMSRLNPTPLLGLRQLPGNQTRGLKQDGKALRGERELPANTCDKSWETEGSRKPPDKKKGDGDKNEGAT